MVRLLTSLLIACSALLCTCGPAPDEAEPTDGPLSGEQLIDRAIDAHGMGGWDTLVRAGFTFRERSYGVERQGGSYRYTRTFTDSLGHRMEDVLTNEGLKRTQDGKPVALSEQDSTDYVGSVNSVRYFFMLPHGLRDPAVQTRVLDTVTIDGEPYDRLEVTFERDGGGTDFDDVYHYFLDRRTGELDYLAYNFAVEEGGLRFRRAINKRRVGGVLVQDYVNYGVDGEERDISKVVERYRAGELPELSRIVNTEVRIEGNR